MLVNSGLTVWDKLNLMPKILNFQKSANACTFLLWSSTTPYKIWHYWGTKFQALISLAYSLKYSYNLINYFGPTQIFPKYFSLITQIFSHIRPKNYFGPSHKYYPLYPTYYPTWALTQILIIPWPKLGHKIIPSLQKAQTHLPCEQNPKSPTKLSLQSTLLHGTLKLVITRHL